MTPADAAARLRQRQRQEDNGCGTKRLLRETRARVAATCGERRVKVRADTPEGIPTFTRDAAQTRRRAARDASAESADGTPDWTNLVLSYIYADLANKQLE